MVPEHALHRTRQFQQDKPFGWYYDFDRDMYHSPLTRQWWGFLWGSFVEWPFFRLLMAIGVWTKEEGYTLRSGHWVWPPQKTFRRKDLPFGWLSSIPMWYRGVLRG